MILILSDESDLHADVVCEKLRAGNAEYFRLNLDVESLKTTSISIEKGVATVIQGKTLFDSRYIKSIWCRKNTVSLTLEQEVDVSNSFRLWRSEWNRALFGLYYCLKDAYWMNNIRYATLADNKFVQIDAAKAAGFNVPDQITSNKSELLMEFAARHGDVALKFMSQDIYKNQSGDVLGLYVNKIGPSDLAHFGGTYENPVTLQKYIDKAYELRVTYVDGQHFTCRIDSQKSERAKTDWRRYDIANTPHSADSLDVEHQKILKSFMSALNLNFGALDFIVGKDGKLWFLEVNSSGQWLWIEDLSGLKISDSISGCLARHANVDNLGGAL
jgi:glutathione synthase/RimK-type ligase-like ATP-grasp enzyme